ncbi:MAG: hypothetical protein IPO27_14495 [Bacteroidetes bacterium]|nr:hypothetical protein [Bacteroidota bacterium]
MRTSAFILFMHALLAFAIGAYTLVGQAHPKKRMHATTLNYEQGLMHNSTSSIVTDSKGFIWISTQIGLQRFNGYRFKTVTPFIDGYGSVQIDYAVNLLKLSNDFIIITSKQGLLKYDINNDCFSFVNKRNAKGELKFATLPLAELNGKLYCLIENEIVSYNVDSLSHEGRECAFPTSVTSNFFTVNTVISNFVFVGGPYCVNGERIIFSDFNSVYEFNTSLKKFTLIKKQNDKIFGLASIGSYYYELGDSNLVIYSALGSTLLKTFTIANLINEKVEYASLTVKNSRLFISINNHIYESDSQLLHFTELIDLKNQNIVPVGYIVKVYPDQFNRVWVITNNDIKRVQDASVPFEHLFYDNAKNNFVKTIYVDTTEGIILAGCFNGGLQLYSVNGKALLSQPIVTSDVKDIMAIEKLSSGNFLVSTYFNGWYIFNYEKKIFSKVTSSKKEHQDFIKAKINFSNNIIKIGADAFIIATATNVYKCSFKENVLISAVAMFAYQDPFKIAYTHATIKKNGDIVAATNNGLVITRSVNQYSQFSIVGNFTIRAIKEATNGNLWVGSDKGLYVYSPKGKLIISITDQQGLTNDCIYSIIPSDEVDAVYVSTNLGLSHVYMNGKIINYPKEVGLQENEFNTASNFKTGDGFYYFGGINGITRFRQKELSRIDDNPIIQLTSLIVNDSVYSSSTGIWQGNEIKLKYFQNHLQFDVVAIGMLNPSEYNYWYRLTGFENNWQATNNPRNIHYTLTPGTYQLEIKCSPIQNDKKAFTHSYSITIFPPWYNTWWFYFLVAGIISLAAYLLFQYRLKQLLRIQEIRNRIASDLHDEVGSALSSIHLGSNLASSLISKDLVKSKVVLERISKTSKQSIERMSDIVWSINPKNDSGRNILAKIKFAATELLESKNIAVHYNIYQGFEKHKFEMEQRKNLFLIFKEAIHNVSKNSEAANCYISILKNSSFITMEITDDGKGFDLLNKQSLGNGIENMKRRAFDMDAKFTLDSAVGKGTTIRIEY